MSSPKVRNESADRIAKPEKDTEKCGNGRASRLPTHTRSPSVSGQKSKIPTNIGPIGRSAAGMQSQVQDNSRLLTAVASDETTVDKGSPINSGRRPTSKSATTASVPPTALNAPKAKSSTIPGGHSAMLKRHLESQFATKKKRYSSLKKELTDKQKNASDLYEEMSQLRDKLIANGGKDPGKIETINLTGIPSQPTGAQFSVDPYAFRGSGEQVFTPNSAVTSELVSTLEAKLRQVPNRWFDFCEELLRNRSEILQRLEEFKQKNVEPDIGSEMAKQLEIYHKESSDLETRLHQSKKSDEEALDEVKQKMSVLWNEVEVSRSRIHELENTSEEMIKELHVKVDAALEEKKIEGEKYEQLQERKQTLETELQKLKIRIRGMETRATDDETKISQLQNNVKNLESQLKQKESGVEQKLKEMQKSLKNSESLLVKTEKQRDNFESRLNELKKNLGLKETEAETKIKDLMEQLEAANIRLSEMEEKRAEFLNGMEPESALVERDEKIVTLQREKEDILRVMYHGLFGEGSDFVLAVDGSSHEMVVSALMKKMQDIRINIRLTQQKNENLQKQIRELVFRVPGKSNEDGSGKSVWSSQVIDLQQQVCDLRCNVTKLTNRNEELEIQLNQKQLEIEKQDRAMREQSTVLKVRDEVIELLKGRPNVEGGHLPVAKKRNREQVDKEIAEKTENLHQLYSTLEAKQMQITRLEQLVKQMEIQQDRAQEQRTRLEKKIAQLQLAMHNRATKSHRYVAIENPVSSLKVSSAPTRVPSHDQQSLQHPAIPPKLQKDLRCQPRSCSKPPFSRSPLRHPQIQRSKTLNSIQLKSRKNPSKEYATQVMDEIARTLRREKAYDYQKRGLREQRNYLKEGRGAAYVEGNVPDSPSITKNEIHESFYNWLVEPWLFGDEPSNVLVHPSSPLRQNHWPRGHTVSSDISVNVTQEDPGPHRHRAPHDCSRENRCGIPECRRQSVPDWDCSPSPPRVRTSPQDNSASRSRRQRS